jgi:predicted aminopeptidase
MSATTRAWTAAWLFALAGCSSMEDGPGFYWQSASGHLDMMRRARPLDEVLADPGTSDALRTRLARARDMRAFASRELALPDNRSFSSYADLGRPFVLWNVFATESLSMQLKSWCFPVAGCIGYRGYYDREQAMQFAARLRRSGLEVHVGGVPAYSTLGWFPDPLLSTFIGYSEGELARLIFHELAHQVVYVKGDTTFNESFASAVEEIGVDRWFAARPDPAALTAYRELAQRRRNFVALLVRHKAMLQTVYEQETEDAAKLRGKQAVFDGLRSDYLLLKQTWGGFSGYDRWFTEPLTNAHLAAVGAYNDRLPAFRALFEASGSQMPAFYEAARALGALPPAQRNARLDALAAQAAARPRGD